MNDTKKNLLEAFQNYQVPNIQHVYRIYYDPISGDITRTDIVEHNEPNIIVDQKTFNNLVAAQSRIINGKIEKKEFSYSRSHSLIKDQTGEIKTIKNRAMFLVDSSYTGPTDLWTLK